MGALPPAYSMDHFWAGIPVWMAVPENIFRLLLCFLPFLMPLEIESKAHKFGLGLVLFGLVAYYLAWGAQIFFPLSPWSTSLAGFLAPAYAPILWFAGNGLIGHRIFFKPSTVPGCTLPSPSFSFVSTSPTPPRSSSEEFDFF